MADQTDPDIERAVAAFRERLLKAKQATAEYQASKDPDYVQAKRTDGQNAVEELDAMHSFRERGLMSGPQGDVRRMYIRNPVPDDNPADDIVDVEADTNHGLRRVGLKRGEASALHSLMSDQTEFIPPDGQLPSESKTPKPQPTESQDRMRILRDRVRESEKEPEEPVAMIPRQRRK